jgi:hypothetical protein
MRKRAIPVIATLALATGALAAAAGPARAANGPPQVGCTTGSSCMVELNYLVHYSGSSGGHNRVTVPPPPCIGVPAGDAHTGSAAIISLYGDTAPVSQPTTAPPSTAPADPTMPADPAASPTLTPTAPGGSPSPTGPVTTPPPATQAPPTPQPPALSGQLQSILDQAKTLVNSNPITPGEWYQISGDPAVSAADREQCNNLPPYVWVAGGQRLPRLDGLNIPPETLAKLAYSQLTTAQLAQATLNPAGTSDTNLPTFVDVSLRPPVRGILQVTADGDPYVWATATTPARESATVWAWATGMTVSPGTADATTWSQQRCSTAHTSADGHTFILGSRYTKPEMAQVGVGQQIDCGVTYTAPGRYNLTANVTWDACWALGTATAGGPPPGCKPVPGAGGLDPSTTPAVQVNVRAITSVNG